MTNWYTEQSGTVADLQTLIQQHTQAVDYPQSAEIKNNVPFYDGATLGDHNQKALMAEWVNVLRNGPGIIAIKSAFTDTAIIDRATAVFETLIAKEKAAGATAADHFAKPGANDRIWNVA